MNQRQKKVWMTVKLSPALQAKADAKRAEKISRLKSRKALVLGQITKNRLFMEEQGASKITGSMVGEGVGAKPLGALAKNPLKTGTCAYCGADATGVDHVIPLIYYGRSGRRRRQRTTGFTVECCLECNLHLSSSLIPSVVDRAAFLFGKWKVRKRYSWGRLEHLERVALEG